MGAREAEIQSKERDGVYEGWWKVRVTAKIDVPAGSTFPSEVPLTIYVGPTYPFSDFAVFPEHGDVRGYPHQDAETGKLCPWPDAVIGHRDDRLWQIFRAAVCWLGAAANGELAASGDRYELPDFSRRNYRFQLQTPRPHLLFVEDADTFHEWQVRLGRHGLCDLGMAAADHQVLVVLRFFDEAGTLLYGCPWGTRFAHVRPSCQAAWILLAGEPLAERKRPCQFWGELRNVFRTQDVCFEEIFTKHIGKLQPLAGKYYLLLLGFPIPQVNGGAACEIHWQPLLTERWDSEKVIRVQVNGFREGKAPHWLLYGPAVKRGIFRDDACVWWAKSTNVASTRLFGRGKLDEPLASYRIAVIGVGCLGAHIATALAREGARAMDLFDGDLVEPGNLCRHTSTIEDVEQHKTDAVAKMLASASPHIEVGGHTVSLPVESDSDAWRALTECDLWLNCTGSERIGAWLSAVAQKLGKDIASIYITHGARYICMYGNGKDIAATDVHEAILELRHDPACAIPDDFFESPRADDEFVEGPGCWHPTFPARLHDILMLVGLAVDRLNAKLRSGSEHGWGVVAGFDEDRTFGKAPCLQCFLETDGFVSKN